MCLSALFAPLGPPLPPAKISKPGTSGREHSSKEQGGTHTCGARPQARGGGGVQGVDFPLPARSGGGGGDYLSHQSGVGAGPCASRKPQESSLRPSRKKILAT